MNKRSNSALELLRSHVAGGPRPPGWRRRSARHLQSRAVPARVAARLFVALAILTLSAPRARADWPLVRGDANATGAIAEKIQGPIDVLWTYPARDSGFEATAAIVGGIVYVGDMDGTFHAVNLADGKPVWTKKFEDSGFVAGTAVVDDRIYCVDFNGIVRALSTQDGAELWKFETNTLTYAAPNVHEGKVLIAAESGELFALDAATGDKVWEPFSIDQPLRAWPTVVGGRVLVAGCDGKLHSVDVNTGKAVEAVDIGGPADGMPAVLGNQVFFCTAGGVFHAMTINPLAPQWEYGHRGQSEELHAAAVSEKAIVLGTHDKRVVAIIPTNGEPLWEFPLTSRAESSPVIAGDAVFTGTVRGRFHAIELSTGKEVWQTDVGGRFTASPAISDGRIVIGNEDGALYCIGAKK